jgi:hypothetical protein
VPFKKGKSGNPRKQFERGKSGNPKGKEPGTKNRATILKELLSIARTIAAKSNPSGKEITGTVEHELELAILSKALKGDVAAYREIKDTVYGKQSNVNFNLNPEELTNLTDEELDSLITKANR